MKRPFLDDGCPVCRDSWLTHRTIDEQIGVGDWNSRVFRCRVCGTHWLETQRTLVPVSERKALREIRREPDPDRAPLPDFLVLEAHREWPIDDGRVILPDMPYTESVGHDEVLRWQAEVLAAIADVLDADPGATRYVLQLQHATYGGGRIHRDGYNLLVPGPLDWEKAKPLLDPNLPADWTPDGGTGPTKAIGSLSRSIPVRGPAEVETVGSGFAGRRRLAQRARDFDAWQASIQ
jgi:hypothetical protein